MSNSTLSTLRRLDRVLSVAGPDSKEDMKDFFERWTYSLTNFNEKVIENGKMNPGMEEELLRRITALEKIYEKELKDTE